MDDKQLTLLRRHKIGFIFQSFNLLPMFTAEQNILMPLTLAGDKRPCLVRSARRNLGTQATAQPSSERAVRWPAAARGHRPRADYQPKLVFADEPTGNLDSVSSAEVLGFLKRSVNELGQTIVMVTHDAVAASYADRALVFADGQIVADVNKPTADQMSELLMKEREAATMNVASARHSR